MAPSRATRNTREVHAQVMYQGSKRVQSVSVAVAVAEVEAKAEAACTRATAAGQWQLQQQQESKGDAEHRGPGLETGQTRTGKHRKITELDYEKPLMATTIVGYTKTDKKENEEVITMKVLYSMVL